MKVVGALGPHGISVDPEPVVVRVGDQLEWELTTSLPNLHILWTVYFSDDGPFGPRVTQITIYTTNLLAGGSMPTGSFPPFLHVGHTLPTTALTPGDHKYGIRAIDADTEQVLADDDPHVIVLP